MVETFKGSCGAGWGFNNGGGGRRAVRWCVWRISSAEMSTLAVIEEAHFQNSAFTSHSGNHWAIPERSARTRPSSGESSAASSIPLGSEAEWIPARVQMSPSVQKLSGFGEKTTSEVSDRIDLANPRGPQQVLKFDRGAFKYVRGTCREHCGQVWLVSRKQTQAKVQQNICLLTSVVLSTILKWLLEPWKWIKYCYFLAYLLTMNITSRLKDQIKNLNGPHMVPAP